MWGFIFTLLIGVPAAVSAQANGLRISEARVPAAYKGESAPVVMYLRNAGDTARELVGAESPMADQVVLQHFVKGSNGLMRVQGLKKLIIPARGEVVMAPDGIELMMLGLKQDLQMDYDVPVILKFSDGQERTVRAHVVSD